MSSVIKDIMHSLNEGVLSELKLSKSIAHSGESGRAREKIIINFLKRILPSKYKVDTGFVIDVVGGISKQIDVVIYRDSYHSVLEIGEVKYFMVESVVAVIEVKASIKDKATLHQALQNIKSVKALDRSNKGKNDVVYPNPKPMQNLIKILGDGLRGILQAIKGEKNGFPPLDINMIDNKNPLDRNEFRNQVFGAIITEKSMSSTVLRDEFKNFIEDERNLNYWPNMYVDVRGGSLRYTTKDHKVTVIAKDAYAFLISDPDAENYTPPLLELAYELISYLRVAPLVDFQPHEYFYGNCGKYKEYVRIERP
ncbi:DUF6602 domain-containing protein [Vibrio parahaemolyticus]|uniref:DUF6602 domain-containing protein n=1 Tax=Vibrio parahaemolyticus TaxID=670 RepID=UPI0003E228F5|nr:DUF6602 domain-containing protein [Vibrio parahaemolyticus]EGQ7665383.1 hypothetical protein [Vibrio parahaemolyticus]EGQ7830806.1 hypothetical protein [Vibrio parahaemolyticus]EGR0036467.1 hypothetical protein [Vibrio parahaemolyticus]EGR0204815.1 hypothetical protein [Vibrio parahaemolyticus]EGR0257253.1 hypothetical protein [Vibrio parahaemolyticus]